MKNKRPEPHATRGKYAAAFTKGVRVTVHRSDGDQMRRLRRNANGTFTWTSVRRRATG